MPKHPPADSPSPNSPEPRRRPGQGWRSLVDQRIRQAEEDGKFDNLPGAGKPLEIEQNPAAGEKALAYSILKQHNDAPPEVELGRDVDALLAQAEKLRTELRQRRANLLLRGIPAEGNRQMYRALRTRYAARYAAAVREARSKVLTLNIIAPVALHRPLVDAAALIAAFEAEFPHDEPDHL
jgi:DnaJ family protein C protein 28